MIHNILIFMNTLSSTFVIWRREERENWHHQYQHKDNGCSFVHQDPCPTHQQDQDLNLPVTNSINMRTTPDGCPPTLGPSCSQDLLPASVPYLLGRNLCGPNSAGRVVVELDGGGDFNGRVALGNDPGITVLVLARDDNIVLDCQLSGLHKHCGTPWGHSHSTIEQWAFGTI